MAYEKHLWKSGEKITASNLNHMEDGIFNNAENINKTKEECKKYTDTAINALDVPAVGSTGSYIKIISETNGKIDASLKSFDTTITDDSATNTNAPTSKAVKTYVNDVVNRRVSPYWGGKFGECYTINSPNGDYSIQIGDSGFTVDDLPPDDMNVSNILLVNSDTFAYYDNEVWHKGNLSIAEEIQRTTINSITNTASRTYAIQQNDNNQLVVNVPWTDNNTHNSHIVYSGTKADGATNISSGTASSGNITLGDSGVTAGSYGDNANQTPGYGSTFKVPYITVNSKGIVTGLSSHTVKIPASDNTNTSHDHSAGVGLTGSGNAGTSSGTYTYKVNLVNETKSGNAASYTAGGTSKFYAVQLDKDNKLGVYVPWTDNNTTYSAGTGLSLSNGVFSVKTGYTTNDKNYKVTTDSSGNLYVNVPWTDNNTTYSIATSAVAGLVKSSNTGTTSGRDYKVEVNSDGTMKVNVPWTDHYTWSDITGKPTLYRHDLLIKLYSSSPAFYANISCTIFNKSNTPITSISSLYDKISSKEISVTGSASYTGTYYNPIITLNLPTNTTLFLTASSSTVTDGKLKTVSLTLPNATSSNSSVTDVITSISL